MDRLSDHLHPVHRALHIFARLGMLTDFKAWYLECRRPMAEMRSMITRYDSTKEEPRKVAPLLSLPAVRSSIRLSIVGTPSEFVLAFFPFPSPLLCVPCRDIDNLDTEAFLTYLPTLANGVGGFFIVEQTLLQQVRRNFSAKEGCAQSRPLVGAVPRQISLTALTRTTHYRYPGVM